LPEFSGNLIFNISLLRDPLADYSYSPRDITLAGQYGRSIDLLGESDQTRHYFELPSPRFIEITI
jgi:hypothetical protein